MVADPLVEGLTFEWILPFGSCQFRLDAIHESSDTALSGSESTLGSLIAVRIDVNTK